MSSLPRFAVVALSAAAACGAADTSTTPPDGGGSAWLVFSTASTGTDLDTDGFVAVVDSVHRTALGATAVDSARLAPGAHAVALTGVASQCAVAEGKSAVVRLAPGQRQSLRYTVTCGLRQLAVSVAVGARYRIWMVNRDGSSPVELAPSFDDQFVERWSPDGARLLYAVRTADGSDLWITHADGSDVRRITSAPGVEHGGSWSPDGSRIVFHAVPPGASAQLHVMNADGTADRAITSDAWSNAFPRWSPDGTRVVFYRVQGARSEVATMAPDGTGVRALTPSTLIAVEPTWSPDGKRIAFVARPAETPTAARELYVMDADGANVRQLTREGSTIASPDWSPDGGSIAFAQGVSPVWVGLYSFADATVRALPISSSALVFPAWRP
jgi:TolB protein